MINLLGINKFSKRLFYNHVLRDRNSLWRIPTSFCFSNDGDVLLRIRLLLFYPYGLFHLGDLVGYKLYTI